MPFLDKTYLQFLALLRAGLWGKQENEQIFHPHVDWIKVMRVAREQACLGITFDGLKYLQSCKPDKKLLMEWFSSVQRIEHINSIQCRAIVSIISKYRENKIEPVLLKGQSVAQYYRNPKHRQGGDIDLYLKDAYDEANAIIGNLPNARGHEETIYHKSFSVSGQEIENHRCLVHFYNKKNQEAWEAVMSNCSQITERVDLSNDDGRTFPLTVLNPQMNAIYLYLHLQHHLLQTGVGLRQVCDWACLWKEGEKDIDKDLFLKVVDALPIRRCMSALTWIVVNYLGLPSGVIPLDINNRKVEKDGELLLNVILEGGNFGLETGVMDGFVRNRHWNNMKSYAVALRHMMRVRRLCPSEVDAYIRYWVMDKIKTKLRNAQA